MFSAADAARIAVAARGVEGLRTRWKLADGAAGPTPQADAPLLPEMRAAVAGTGADEQIAAAAVRACALLALCGWSPVPIPSSQGPPAAVASAADGDAVKFCCDWCGRCIPLSSFATAAGGSSSSSISSNNGGSASASASLARGLVLGPGHDLLAQHRAFCVWSHVEAGGDAGDDLSLSLAAAGPRLPGWLHCARALAGESDGDSADRSDAAGQARAASEMLRGDGDGEGEATERGGGHVDAEQAYKRIKRIMGVAAVKRQ